MANLTLVPVSKRRARAAEVLRTIGYIQPVPRYDGGLIFKLSSYTPHFFFERLRSVFNDDGSFNGASEHAEAIALCLKYRKEERRAFELFLAIADGNEDFLSVFDPPVQGINHALAIAEESGELGYEGVYQFGELAAKYERSDLARKLFREIVEKIPETCSPVRLQRIREACVARLKNLG